MLQLKMNLAIRGISANLGEHEADTFHNDQHKDLKADFIMANPPFNQSSWREENQLTDDPRWVGFDVPPTSNANYGWILNMVSKLSTNGVAGFILANGALSAGGTEYNIRRRLLEKGFVEAIIILPRKLFYSTDISVSLWVLNANKKARIIERDGEQIHLRDREREVLFMDLRQRGVPFEKKYVQLSPEDIAEAAGTYHRWQLADANLADFDIPEYCYAANFDEIGGDDGNDFSLVPSKYIHFGNNDNHVDYDARMRELQTEIRTLLQQEEQSKQEIKALFANLGYSL